MKAWRNTKEKNITSFLKQQSSVCSVCHLVAKHYSDATVAKRGFGWMWLRRILLYLEETLKSKAPFPMKSAVVTLSADLQCTDENRGRLQLEWKLTFISSKYKVSFPALNQGNDCRRWMCRRGRHCRRHCQLDCSKDDTSLPVVMVILTFWSLSYSPLAPHGRKPRIIFDWLYVSYFSAYSNNCLIELRGWRRGNPYL